MTKCSKLITLGLGIVTVTLLAVASRADLPIIHYSDGSGYLADRFIVTTRAGVPSLTVGHAVDGIAVTGVKSIDDLCAKYDIASIESFYPAPVRLPHLRDIISRMYIFHIAQGGNVASIKNNFSTIPAIEAADLYIIPILLYTPNDPSVNSQWHLYNTHTLEGWDIFRGDTTRYAIIGISDTGIYWNHPDLHANMWINVLEDLNNNRTLDSGDLNGIDDDGNGFVDDVIGWDFASNDNNPVEDSPIHGTHVAGCASEVTDNNINGAGLGFSARLLAAKGGRHDTLTAVWQALVYAADNGAQILNCSWGSGSYSQTYQNLVNSFWNDGAIIIAAAGNNNDSVRFYPAAYDNVIAVAATYPQDHKASFSNYGTWIDISAPGENIYSTWSQNTMTYLSGTSMASPIVCGLAALLKAQRPACSNQQIIDIILETADSIDNLNPGYAGLLGAGRINTFRALQTFYVSGDINGDAVFNGIDLGYGVNFFKGIGGPPPYSLNCRNHGVIVPFREWEKNPRL